MYTNSAPLAATVNALRTDALHLLDYVDEMARRIDRVDEHVHAFLPEPARPMRLHAEARVLQGQYSAHENRPALYGALVGIKDIIHVNGFVTRAGSEVPPERFAAAEGEGLRRLRAAGALIAGKTVTTEFAYFEPGPTRNPHDPMRTPGGSSSGSAAAVAAGMCQLALGTQTIGSVIRPAAFCGVVGFKPTYGRIPSEGIVYFSRTADHIGLFTQDVAGMALAAGVLCDNWRADITKREAPVLGVPDGPYLAQTEPAALRAFEAQLAALAGAGVTIRRVPTLAGIAELNELHRRLVFGEFAREHAALYATYSHLYRPRTAEIVEIGRTVEDAELEELARSCRRLRADLAARMTETGIDLWVCPAATGVAPEGIDATGDPNMNLPWTHAGMPAVTLPAGRGDQGLPLGLQLIGRFGEDEALLAWASQIQAAMSAPPAA
jgi:Asp-tRNA(Asn)/Glu-tRNA(Gln) amidotransferase A subunit family amidase